MTGRATSAAAPRLHTRLASRRATVTSGGRRGSTLSDLRSEYTCAYCGKRYVVGSLARDCEKRHEEEA